MIDNGTKLAVQASANKAAVGVLADDDFATDRLKALLHFTRRK